MKPIWKEIGLAVLFGMVLPWVVLNLYIHCNKAVPEPTIAPGTEPMQEGKQLTMYLRRGDGEVTETDMDDYLTGVLLGELPATFEPEAKKAQAVAARTFAWKAVVTGGKHGDGSVCTESTCCQAYVNPGQYSGSPEAVQEARQAVEATSGLVLYYDGSLIEATYFSCSGGSTEDAVAVWGTSFPYLRATVSTGEENAVHFTDTVTYTKQELESLLGISLSGRPDTWIGLTTYTAGRGIATMEICGHTFQGTELRSLLKLRSTAITVSVKADGLEFTTRGYGHRVGMSQYGAEAMAVAGATYEEILAHYYRGTVIGEAAEN